MPPTNIELSWRTLFKDCSLQRSIGILSLGYDFHLVTYPHQLIFKCMTQREFTYLLLPLLHRKLRRTVPALVPHPPILAHTIYQALSFDSALREEGFEIRGTSATASKGKDGKQEEKEQKWEGASEVILGRREWFEAWMEGERVCKSSPLFILLVHTLRNACILVAMDQYMEIISAQDAWLIIDDTGDDDESVIDRELKPTNSARRVKALVEQVTG